MPQLAKFDFQAKIICVGDSGVGKTSLAIRFVNDEWTPSFISTIGIDYKHRIVNIDGIRVRLIVWDSAGQERYKTITGMYYRGSQGVLLVYDVSDYSSFEAIHKWVDFLDDSEIGKPRHVSRILVGNKSDSTNRAVTTEQGQKLAEELGAMFCETSAKSSDGVMAAFMMLARDIKRRFDENSNSGSKGEGGGDETTSANVVLKPASKSWSSGVCCTS